MATATFGVKLEVWDPSASPAPAFVEIKGLTDLTPPTKQADEPVDVTNHNSTAGVREFVPAGTLTWTDCSGEMNDLPSDAGQVIVAAAVDTERAFQVTKKSDVSHPIQFWAIVKSFTQGANPVNGKATRSIVLKPTGAAEMP